MPYSGGGCRRHEHGVRGGCGKSYGDEDRGNFLHFQCGGRDSPNPLTHEEIQRTADSAAPKFQKLVYESIVRMGEWMKQNSEVSE